jgi:hypothetical protein
MFIKDINCLENMTYEHQPDEEANSIDHYRRKALISEQNGDWETAVDFFSQSRDPKDVYHAAELYLEHGENELAKLAISRTRLLNASPLNDKGPYVRNIGPGSRTKKLKTTYYNARADAHIKAEEIESSLKILEERL